MPLKSFLTLIAQHTEFRRKSLNLIASENYSSPLVRAILANDLGNRYHADFYGGTKFIRKIISKTESFIRELYNADYAIISPLSGNMCDLALLFGFTKLKDKIMVVEAGDFGGYPLDYEFFGRKKISFVFNYNIMNILIEDTIAKIKQEKPKLVIFGSSFLPFPHPVKEITDEFDKRKSIRFCYDGSHVMGLIAGKQFQDPLKEGANVLVGSTHKSFPGPQGGIILTNDMMSYETLTSILDLDLEKGIRLIDNNHPNRIAALGIAALEMIEYGSEYASQIIKNSKALAQALDKYGVPVKFKEIDYTESHQVLINTKDNQEGFQIKERAEKYNLNIDSGIRLGTAEITRMGMKELEMKEIAEIFSQIYFDNPSKDIERRISNIVQIFNHPQYCYTEIESIDF